MHAVHNWEEQSAIFPTIDQQESPRGQFVDWQMLYKSTPPKGQVLATEIGLANVGDIIEMGNRDGRFGDTGRMRPNSMLALAFEHQVCCGGPRLGQTAKPRC